MSPQFIFYVLCMIVLIYYTANIVVLFAEDALRNVVVARIAFWSVHFMTGMVIIIPVLLLSFLPLFVDLQTRMLFNEEFSARYVSVVQEATDRGGTGIELAHNLDEEIFRFSKDYLGRVRTYNQGARLADMNTHRAPEPMGSIQARGCPFLALLRQMVHQQTVGWGGEAERSC